MSERWHNKSSKFLTRPAFNLLSKNFEKMGPVPENLVGKDVKEKATFSLQVLRILCMQQIDSRRHFHLASTYTIKGFKE